MNLTDMPPMQIGPITITRPLILAPMAGVTDRPFRQLCRHYGAGLAVSEMVSSNPALRHGKKSILRTDHTGESEPRSVQILGNDPNDMAEAARINADRGAQIIDINMGCPAKKVCRKAAGSALMKDQLLIARILEAVVTAVDVPVTLKIRTGWDKDNRNAPDIAKIAEESGIKALTVHGRTRECGFLGDAEYLTIREVKKSVNIPVIANGDIDSPEKAAAVLKLTSADAVMIGRAAFGQPWLFKAFFAKAGTSAKPDQDELRKLVLHHVQSIHEFYGEQQGLGIARKHVGWYLKNNQNDPRGIQMFNLETTARGQVGLIESLF